MKRFASVIMAIAVILPFIKCTSSSAINFPIDNPIHSESAIVLNLDNDVVIHEQNADLKQMPGPLVNIMTAIICLESNSNLSQELTVDNSVYTYLVNTQFPEDLRSGDIRNGDVLTINDLLYAMMLTSSYEASMVLADHFGDGDIEAFVEKMNAKASAIGCTDTHFTNPTGLYDEDQYTTARDMAIITKYALKSSVFVSIATEWSYKPSVPNLENHPDPSKWIWTHSNTMMDEENSKYYYRGVKGIKTGNLSAAGRNIVVMASKDGNNYLAVLLKAPISDADGDTQFYHLDDAKTVFDWVFNHFSYKDIVTASEEIAEVPVELADGNDFVLLKPASEYTALWYDSIETSLIKKEIQYDSDIKAPVKAGDKLGVLHLMYSGEEIASIDLVAVSDVERSASKFNIYVAKRFKNSQWFGKAFLISGILCLIYILLCFYSFICFKNRSKPVKPVYAMPNVSKKKKSNRKNNE